MDFRPIFYVVGILLSTLAVSMSLPMLIDMYYRNPDWKVFFICILATVFFGGIMVVVNSGHELKISTRQGFLLITSCWVALSVFASLPFWLSELGISFTDSVFEAVSGLTTTGSTVLTDLNHTPRGILIWRAMLQWLGGIGIILMAVSVMPFLKIGGMQLFKIELSENEKALPRIASFAKYIGLIYVFFTFICMIAYHLAGMGTFDSLAHAMTTIATGGYSTYDTSFSHYHEPWIEVVAIIFMLIGGLPFVLFVKALNGNIRPLFVDAQVRGFLLIVSVAAGCLVFYLMRTTDMEFGEALLASLFNVVSVVTGTGYVNDDYGAWGNFAIGIFFFLMMLGACAGSTSCGIKIFRLQILYDIAKAQVKQLLHPHGVFIPHYNKKPIPDAVAASVMSFFFLFALCFTMTAVALSFSGLDFMTAMSGAATTIANVGPGLGDIIGPDGTFQPLPSTAKWVMIVTMLVGRLEIFPILLLFTPKFWQR